MLFLRTFKKKLGHYFALVCCHRVILYTVNIITDVITRGATDLMIQETTVRGGTRVSVLVPDPLSSGD